MRATPRPSSDTGNPMALASSITARIVLPWKFGTRGPVASATFGCSATGGGTGPNTTGGTSGSSNGGGSLKPAMATSLSIY